MDDNTENALLTVIVGRAFCCGEILTDMVE